MPVDAGEPGDERGAVLLLELPEPAAVDDPRDHFPYVVRGSRVGRHHPVQLAGSAAGSSVGATSHGRGARGPSVETIERTIRNACPSSSARWSVTPDCREWTSPPPSSSAVTTSPVAAFTSGGPAEEDRALVADDHGLVAHGRHVRAAGRAGPQHGGELRDAVRGHGGLVEEDATEVLTVREDLVLPRQERPTGVDEVDARQVVVQRDFLRAKVLLDGHRVVRAALDRRVVGDDHALAARRPGRPR